MHHLQRQLYLDHYNLERVMSCLKTAVNDFAQRRKSAKSLDLILDILDYVQVYPQKWHHPLEDLVFTHLVDKAPKEKAVIEEIMTQHSPMENMVGELKKRFEAVAQDCVERMDGLLDETRRIICSQLDHIDQENKHVYPLFSIYLQRSDWVAFADRMPWVGDPLFGKDVKDHYQNLVNKLMAEERRNILSRTA